MNDKPKILLLSNRDDFTTDFIASKLKERNLPYARINSEDITEREFTFIPGEMRVLGDEVSPIDLSFIQSVYFRRVPTVFINDTSKENIGFLNRERREFLEGLSLLLDAKWINSMQATILGERKLFQLELAKKQGLQIPKTIVTNDPKRASNFLLHTNDVVTKPISHGFMIENGEFYSIYTNQLNSSSFNSINQLIESPMMIQERIVSDLELRVTIIGTKVYSVGIKKENSAIVDWRRSNVKKIYTLCDLPKSLENKLIEYTQRLGLVYAAIDLIHNQNGDYIFLEINPVGEWLWLELELGLHISDTIIGQLMKGN